MKLRERERAVCVSVCTWNTCKIRCWFNLASFLNSIWSVGLIFYWKYLRCFIWHSNNVFLLGNYGYIGRLRSCSQKKESCHSSSTPESNTRNKITFRIFILLLRNELFFWNDKMRFFLWLYSKRKNDVIRICESSSYFGTLEGESTSGFCATVLIRLLGLRTNDSSMGRFLVTRLDFRLLTNIFFPIWNLPLFLSIGMFSLFANVGMVLVFSRQTLLLSFTAVITDTYTITSSEAPISV